MQALVDSTQSKDQLAVSTEGGCAAFAVAHRHAFTSSTNRTPDIQFNPTSPPKCQIMSEDRSLTIDREGVDFLLVN